MKSIIFCDMTPCTLLSATDVSEEHIASFFRVEEVIQQEPASKQLASRNRLHGVISQKVILFITAAVETPNPARPTT
jgi:hypothetical protein